MQHLIWCDSAVRSRGSLALHSSALTRGHRGRDPSGLTPRRQQHLGFISHRGHTAADRQKSRPLSRAEQRSYNSFFQLYLGFICLPGARPSSAVLWGAGWEFSSLTNVVQIACRATVGEHLHLGPTLFVVAALLWADPAPLFPPCRCSASTILSWRNRSSCLTSFQLRYSGRSGGGSTSFAVTRRNQALIKRKFFCTTYIFVCLLFGSIFTSSGLEQHNNILGWEERGGGGRQGCVQLEVTQHAVVQ